MTASRFVIIDAPSTLGLWESGVGKLPEALKACGLVDRLGARQGPVLKPPAYSPDRDASTGYLNGPGIARYSATIADAFGDVRRDGAMPIILGGDCSILLGATLGLRRQGRYGLFFMDGHADYYAPFQSRTGEVADMDLAIVTGASHPLLANIEGLTPYVRPGDAVLFGFRDEKLAHDEGSQDVRQSGIDVRSLIDIRIAGWGPSLDAALSTVSRPGVDGFFLHFDVDVLDDAVMPAVDYRAADGFTFGEATDVIRRAASTGRLAGMTVTIFNPKLDPDGTIARSLTDCLVQGLRAEVIS